MRLHDFLDSWAARRPEAEFAMACDCRLTYGEAAVRANRIAQRLVGAGLGPGDRVAAVAGNGAHLALAFFAASKAGVALVPVDPRAPDLSAALDAVCPALVLADHPNLTVAAEATDAEIVLIPVADQVAGSPPPPPPPGDHDLLHLATGAAAGRPLSAVLTQRAVTANAQQIAELLEPRPEARTLVVAPMSSAAVVPGVLATVAGGGALSILDGFDPEDVLRAFVEEEIETAVLVAPMLEACLEHAGTHAFPRLRTVYYTGSPVAEPTLRGALRALSCDFVQAYGLAEATHALTFLSPADHRRGLAERPELLLSAGRPAPGTEVRVADDDRLCLPAGAAGEIVARGPQLMRGYWERPDLSAQVLRNGWLRTGDAGYMDADGHLYVRDRLRDVIAAEGEPVSPRLVEERLLDHPAIADAAVVGVPNGPQGELVKAFVVLRPDCHLSADEVIAFCTGRGSSAERPRAVDFLPALPRSATGKVLRDALRYGAPAGA